MELKLISGLFSVCKAADFSGVDLKEDYVFLGKTEEECSIVCRPESVPEHVTHREEGWRGFQIAGELEFSLVGILAKLSGVLAEAGISIFAVSTYNTDYVFIKEEALTQAAAVLRGAGYRITEGV